MGWETLDRDLRRALASGVSLVHGADVPAPFPKFKRGCYFFLLPPAFCLAQRAFCASLIRRRASADIVRRRRRRGPRRPSVDSPALASEAVAFAGRPRRP